MPVVLVLMQADAIYAEGQERPMVAIFVGTFPRTTEVAAFSFLSPPFYGPHLSSQNIYHANILMNMA